MIQLSQIDETSGTDYPDEDYRFFVFDTEERERVFFNNVKARDAYAKECVGRYLEDGEWQEEMALGVLVGEITHLVKQTNVRVETPEGDLDEDGADDNGVYWESGETERLYCNYEPVKIKSRLFMRWREVKSSKLIMCWKEVFKS